MVYRWDLLKIKQKKICLEAVKQNGYALLYVVVQTRKICLEAIKQKIDALEYVNIKYAKFISNYLKSNELKNLNDDYKFIINGNKQMLISNINLKKYIWGIKYVKQDLELCKLVMKFSKYDNQKSNLGNLNKSLSYINFKKLKLCLKIIKTFNDGFKYINKQYISNLLL